MREDDKAEFDPTLYYVVSGDLLNRILRELDGGRTGADEERELRELAALNTAVSYPADEFKIAGRAWDQKGPS